MCNEKKRYYSPQLSEKACITIRRLAWAFNVSMPKAIDIIINELSTAFSSSVVCPQCKDKTKCSVCGFYQKPEEKEEKEVIKNAA
jgi:rubredoxin